MPASPLAATSRFVGASVTHFTWVPTIANTSAPTRAELNAGTDVSGELYDVNGWSVTSDLVDAPDFASRQTKRIPGAITPADSSFSIYRSSTSADARSLLTRDATGFVVVFGEGDVAGKKMDVFPVTVSAAEKMYSRLDPAGIVFHFGITGTVVENVTVPA